MNIGKAIKTYRIQRGLTQGELALIVELDTSYISLVETNKREPSLSAISTIASGLGVPLILLIFMASDSDERAGLSIELHEKLSAAALECMMHKD